MKPNIVIKGCFVFSINFAFRLKTTLYISAIDKNQPSSADKKIKRKEKSEVKSEFFLGECSQSLFTPILRKDHYCIPTFFEIQWIRRVPLRGDVAQVWLNFDN